VIVTDVNVLVYAFDESGSGFARYSSWLADVAGGADSLALIDGVLSEFVRIVTHPKIFDDPAPTDIALEFVQALIDSPSATWLGSNRATWQAFTALAKGDRDVRGNRVSDAYLASVAIANGARLATADRGFARYPGLDWFDPGV
jgi:toxin-antitoxin system PIN domain toxin